MSVWIPVAVAGLSSVTAITVAALPIGFQIWKLRQENTSQHAEGRALIQSAVDGVGEIKAEQVKQGQAITDHGLALAKQGEQIGQVQDIIGIPRSN